MSDAIELENTPSPQAPEKHIVPPAQPPEGEYTDARWRMVHQTAGPVPRPRHGHRAVTIKNNLIVVMGGGNEGMIEELHVYNPSKGEWSTPQLRGELPSSCASFGMIALGTRIYTFGGMVEYGKYSNELNELTATKWEWRRLQPRSNGTDFPSPRLGHSFAASERTQKAYVFGGLANDLNDTKRNLPRYLNDLYVIDLSMQTNNLVWEKPATIGTPPCPRESHTAVIYENDSVSRMIVYGGMNGARLGDLWYLDLKNLEWTEIKFEELSTGIPPIPRSLHTSVLIDDKMFVYGGWVPLTEHATMATQLSEKEWKCTSTLACWDITRERWEPLFLDCNDEEMKPRGRAGHCAAAVGSRMYVWSGRDGYRKAWSNQVCCRDLWLLDTVKPEQPGKVQLSRAGYQSLEVSWLPVSCAEAYLVQIGFGDAKDAPSPTKEVQKTKDPKAGPNLLKRPAPGDQSKESNPNATAEASASGISTQGTTYTAPAASKPATEESSLPQDLFDDPEKTEGKPLKEELNEGESSAPKETDSELEIKEKEKQIEEEETRKKQEQEDLPWFDIGLIHKTDITVTHYFNDRQPRLQEQLQTLIEGHVEKCINDKVFTAEDKVPLITGQTYRFRVAAVNMLGRGAWSESASYKVRCQAIPTGTRSQNTQPGYPSAPSSIRITKSVEGAQLTWEPPGNTNVSGKIVEYSVYLAVKNQNANSADSQLAFMRVYCGPVAECQVPQQSLASAYVDQTAKPAIIFRIAARNEKGYGPATQVRWLQDQQRVPVRAAYPPHLNPGYHYPNGQPPLHKRGRFEPQ